MQSFIVGLLLAGVSAVSFVAFKHPNGYAKLFPYLIGSATAVFVGITVWQAAIEALWISLDGFLAKDSRPDAHYAKAHLSLPYLWAAFTYMGVLAFFWVNLKLPPFLYHTDEDMSPGRDGSG